MSYNSIIEYTGNGSTKDFTISFGYLSPTDVNVYVDDIQMVSTVDYTIDSTTNKISFITAPTNGSDISIQRNTPTTDATVVFQDGSQVTASELNDNTTQTLYSVQELKDQYGVVDWDPTLSPVDATVNLMSDLRSLLIPTTTAFVLVKGRTTQGDSGAGLFRYDPNLVSTVDDGIIIKPTLKGNTDAGRWVRVTETSKYNVKWFGATGNGTTDDSAAIMRAFVAIQTTVDVYPDIAGVLYFPKGRYLCAPNTLDFKSSFGLTLEGEGGKNIRNFTAASSAIVISAGTSPSVNDVGISLTNSTPDFTRDVYFKDISIEYKSGFLGDLLKGNISGVFGYHSSFVSEGYNVLTANSLIRFYEGHQYRFTSCSLDGAKYGIFVDNITAVNGNAWSFVGCDFFDFSDSHVYSPGSSNIAMSFVGCAFDPILGGGVNGYKGSTYALSFNGCSFAGSDNTKSPTDSWINITGGSCDVTGCYFWGADADAIKATGGILSTRGNVFNTGRSIDISGPAVAFTGGGNRHNHTGSGASDVAIKISDAYVMAVDYGGDFFDYASTPYANSYSVTDAAGSGGEIRYNVSGDSSTNKVKVGSNGTIAIRGLNSKTNTVTGNLSLSSSQTGQTFLVTAAADIILPASTDNGGNQRFLIMKQTTATVRVLAGDSTSILGTIYGDTLTNSTNTYGVVEIIATSSTNYIYKSLAGTWTLS